MGDVGFHGGHHGGWEPLILPSPLSLRLQHLQLGRGGPQLGQIRQDSIHNTAGCRMVLVRLDSRHLITLDMC